MRHISQNDIGFDEDGLNKSNANTIGMYKNAKVPHHRIRNRKPIKYDTGYKNLMDEFPDVYNFYKNVAPYIRMRELGVDQLPENERKAFEEILSVPVVYGDDDSVAGYYAPWREFARTPLSKYNPLRYLMPRDHIVVGKRTYGNATSTAAHEIRHALARRISSSKSSNDIRDSVYGFRGTNIAKGMLPGFLGNVYSWLLGDEESATTNVQHQMAEYLRLKDKLGRDPTGPEFLDHIDNLPTQVAIANRERVVNGYQENADSRLAKAKRDKIRQIPYQMSFDKKSILPKWIDLAPHTRKVIESTQGDGVMNIFPMDIESRGDQEEEAKRIREVLGGISMNKSDSTDGRLGNTKLLKTAQFKYYARNGGIAGAITGGGIAALLSLLHYSRNNKDKKTKNSRFKNILKSILWTALGAAGGGIAGAGLGAMIATHVRYKRALDAAIKKVKENRAKLSNWSNGAPVKGRVMYANYPQNRFPIGGWFQKIFGKDSVPIQHANMLVMNEDGSDAIMYSPSLNQNKTIVKRVGESFIEEGKRTNNKSLIEEGENLINGKIDRGSYDTIRFFNMMKGKSDGQIAKILADYGKNNDLGNEVVVYEGKKGVDRDIAEEFMNQASHINHTDGNLGYGICPGFYNCGTASREGFDSVQDPISHWLDTLFGGFPSNNAPSLARKWGARSYDIEGRDDMAGLRPVRVNYRE